MDLNATIDIIIKDLNEVREIIDDLKKYPGVPEFQVEMAKSKCKSISEVIALFKNLQDKVAGAKEDKKVRIEDFKSVINSHKQVENIHAPEKDLKKVNEAPIPEVSTTPEKKSTPDFKKPADSAIIADKFLNRPESYHEKLGSQKHEDDLLEILKTKPLSSLNEAIGVNDKFVFIREIFNGNTESYNRAIEKLESVGSFADARNVLINIIGENLETEATKQLLDLIKRKFPSNE